MSQPQGAPGRVDFESMTAAQAYSYIISNVGATYPKRDQVDSLIVAEVNSRGTQGRYIYRETDMPLINGGAGRGIGKWRCFKITGVESRITAAVIRYQAAIERAIFVIVEIIAGAIQIKSAGTS